MPLSQERTSISILANQFIRKERKYRQFIEINESMGSGIATRLCRGDQFENLVGEAIAEECRESLKNIAKGNVENERKLKAYMNAVKSMDDVSRSEGTCGEVEDFQRKIDETYASELAKIDNESVLVTQESSYQKLCKIIGEQDDQDDELAVVNPNNSNSISRIKCPITMVIMEDPVRSRICSH